MLTKLTISRYSAMRSLAENSLWPTLCGKSAPRARIEQPLAQRMIMSFSTPRMDQARNDLDDVGVQTKKDAAVQWCGHATRHTMNNSGKPWQYLLIPHDVITANMTLAGLASQFRFD